MKGSEKNDQYENVRCGVQRVISKADGKRLLYSIFERVGVLSVWFLIAELEKLNIV